MPVLVPGLAPELAPGLAPEPAPEPVPDCVRRSTENRGMVWVVAAFVICPCHLPLTLGLAATLLAGTAVGSMVAGHPVLAGVVITLAWAAATWRGVRLMRSARAPRCDRSR